MFSNKTLLEIAKSLDFKTHDEVDRFCIEFNLDGIVSGKHLKEKETSIAKHLISNPDVLGPNNSALAMEILEHAIKHHCGFEPFAEAYPDLAHSLDRDGFDLTDSGPRSKMPAELPVVELENRLTFLLKKFDFNIAIGHYDQAVAAHIRGEWAAANAQLRTFVEEFFNKAHEIICPEVNSSTHNAKMNALASAGFFIHDYNEYLHNGTGFVEGFWKRLHPGGSHPGLSEQADSTFRLHLVILVVYHFLARLEANHDMAK